MFELTLIFDDGPDPHATPRVLDIMRERKIKATFFVIGEKLDDAARHRLAGRAHDEGHRIGNHTFTHSVPLRERPGRDTAENEIARTQAAIGELAHAQRWFRPFGGGNQDARLLKPSVVDYLVRHRYSCVLWNAIPRDWEDPDGWVERALDQCRAQPWSLMVLRDLPTRAADRLEDFLNRTNALDARLHQEFPLSCVPIRAGKIVLPIAAYVYSTEESVEP